MKAETPGINGVFQNSTQLIIPFFQRHYVWSDENWKRFHEDMVGLMNTRNRYFLGSLIFKEKEVDLNEAMNGINSKYEVIDGQQRLTTLSIYLKVLHMLIPDVSIRNIFKSTFFNLDQQRHPVLHHSINDRAPYEQVMWLDTPAGGLTHYQDRQIVKAYFYFYNALKDRTDLSRLLMSVYANVKFVSIVLDEHDEEQQIFDTINSLGVDLTIDELMKNYLYDQTHEQEYMNNWRPAFDHEQARKFWGTDDAARRQTDTDESKTIVSFFYNYVRVKMWDFKSQFEEGDRKSFVQRKNIFSTCKQFHERFGLDKQVLANDIIEYSKLYRQYFDKSKLKNRVPSYEGIERIACIAMVKESSIIPYIMYVLRNVADRAEQNRIFGYLETYLMRRTLALNTAQENKNYSEFFSETLIGNRLLTYQSLKDFIERIDSTQHNRMPSNAEMQGARLNTFDETTARLIYYLIETKSNVQGENRGYNFYLAEAIMPSPAKANSTTWPPHANIDDERVRKTKTRSIGNYVQLLVPSDANAATDAETLEKGRKDIRKNANKAFVDKKDALLQFTSDVRCSNWFYQTNNWDELAIDSRCTTLVHHVNQRIWPL